MLSALSEDQGLLKQGGVLEDWSQTALGLVVRKGHIIKHDSDQESRRVCGQQQGQSDYRDGGVQRLASERKSWSSRTENFLDSWRQWVESSQLSPVVCHQGSSDIEYVCKCDRHQKVEDLLFISVLYRISFGSGEGSCQHPDGEVSGAKVMMKSLEAKEAQKNSYGSKMFWWKLKLSVNKT